MVDSTDIVNLQEETEENKLKLATVTELFENGTAKIKFYGEEIESEKEYSYLASYTPKINDVVLLVKLLDTYIILGKVIYGESGETIYDALEGYATKEDIANFITSSDIDLSRYALSSELSSYVKTTTLNNTLRDYPKTNTVAPASHNHTEFKSGGYSAYLHTVNYVPHFVASNGNMGLGTSSYLWNALYARTGTINTSDLRLKNTVKSIKQKYKDLFNKLKPISYKLNDGESGRTHIGYGAQDVEKAMTEVGLDSKDFAGFIKSPNEDGDYEYGLRYAEFIALNTAMIQDLQKEVKELRKEI